MNDKPPFLDMAAPSPDPGNEIVELYFHKAIPKLKDRNEPRGVVDSIALVFMDEIETNENQEKPVTLNDINQVYETDAEMLYRVLIRTLPGGTLDRLTAKLVSHFATSLAVPK